MKGFLMGIVLFLGLIPNVLHSQCADPANDLCGVIPYFNFKLGINLLPLSKAKSGTHMTLSGSMGLMLPKRNFQPNVLLSATLIRGDIGTSLLPIGKPEMRFEGVFTIAGTYSGGNPFMTPELTTMARTFHIGSASNIYLPTSDALTMGTHFVFSKNSVQQLGFVNLKLQNDGAGLKPGVILHYYNDGIPFHLLGLGDAFDRWWTGGGNIEVYWFDTFLKKYNQFKTFKYSVNAGFDKFTGGGKTAIHDPYKFANLILLKDVDYTRNDYNEIFLNRGVFYLGFGIGRFLFEFDLPLAELDIQDLIHKIRRDAYHPKYEKRKTNLPFRYFRYSFVPRVILDPLK